MKENIKSLGIIALGNLLLTSAYAFLTVPNNIINGGVTSTSLLLSHYLNIDIGYISTTITIFLLISGFIGLGKDFFYRSLFSSVCYIVFFNFFHFTGISFSFHPIIIVLFAGIFVGVATFGILSVIYGILFTIIQTQVIYLLNKSHKVNAKILKPTH